MIAQAGAVQHLPGFYLARRSAARLAISCWQSIARVAARHCNLALLLTLAASALTWALASSAIMDRSKTKPDTASLPSVHNETVVYRQSRAPQPNADQNYGERPYTEQIEASDELEDDNVPSSFPRAVQTVRFVNPDPPAGIGPITSPAHESVGEALVELERFVTSPKEKDASIREEESIRVGKRAGLIMDEVDDYLWEVYQRVPTKKDGTGDFTWKDPAAAQHMGIALRDYVIGGMEPEFREQLYHAGQAMDAAGLRWSMLSAFRDDYRQGLASGYKASASSSLHGGSRRTGGYGHGRAIDITGPEDKESDVWKWIDVHGAKYGLHRPLPGRDPAHVQQRGDRQKVALAIRETRTRSSPGHKAKVAAIRSKATVRKTAVASAR